MNIKFLSLSIAASILFLTGCNTTEDTTKIPESITPEPIVKNEPVELPITILVNSEHAKEIAPMTLTRTINSAVISNFNSENEIAQLKHFYDPDLKNLDTSTYEDYKKVTLSMGHDFEESNSTTRHTAPSAPFILDRQTSFIIGKNELLYNEFVNNQLSFLSADYLVKRTADLQKEYILAIPNDFINENLQLKTIQQIDDESKRQIAAT